MSKWRCTVVNTNVASGFTVGKIYEEDKNSSLIDNDGDRRNRASEYNSSKNAYQFEEVVENTPKFKVGDTVSYMKQTCTIRGFSKDGSGIMVEGYSNGHSGSFPEWWFDENGKIQDLKVSEKSDRHYTTLKEIQLIKSTNTNMKYKVKKWYPGCEGTEGEVIETSKDYSTPAYAEFYEEVTNSLPEYVKCVKNTYTNNGDYFTLGTTYKINESGVIISNRGKGDLDKVAANLKNYCSFWDFEPSTKEEYNRTHIPPVGEYSTRIDGGLFRIGCNRHSLETVKAIKDVMRQAEMTEIVIAGHPISRTTIDKVINLMS